MTVLLCTLVVTTVALCVAVWRLSLRMSFAEKNAELLKRMLDNQEHALNVAAGKTSRRTMWDS